MRVRVGDVVDVKGHTQPWQVVSINPSPRSHSCITVWQATVVPIGEAWNKQPRIVPFADLRPVMV